MAIRDLLWACPACGEPNGLVAARRGEVCRACGARVRRGRAATILVDAAGKPPVARPAWDWCADLPALSAATAELEGRAILREAEAARPLRGGDELLGYVESFGPQVPGSVTLSSERIVFQPDRGGAARTWPLLDLTAVQPASSALQLKLRDRPVITIKFTDCSVRLWEQRIQDALRRAFRAAGHGEIIEFQPRISFR